MLEDGGHHAVGSRHGEQVEDDGRDGDDVGAEAEQHQQEGHRRDEREDRDDAAPQLVVEVDGGGGLAGDVRFRSRAGEGGGQPLLAEVAEAGGAVREGDLDLGDVLGAVDGDVVEAREGLADVRGGDVGGPDDDECGGGAAGEALGDGAVGDGECGVGAELLLQAQGFGLHTERGGGQAEEEDGGGDGEEAWPGEDGAKDPADDAAAALAGVARAPVQERDAPRVDPVAEP